MYSYYYYLVDIIARKGYFTASSLVAMVTNSVAMVNHGLEHAYKIELQNIKQCGHISCIKFALNFAYYR